MRGLLYESDALANPVLAPEGQIGAGLPGLTRGRCETRWHGSIAPIVAGALLILALFPPALADEPADDVGQPKLAAEADEGEETPEESFVLLEGQVTNHIGAGQPGVTVAILWKSTGDVEGDVIATVTTDEYGDFVVTTSEPIRGDIVVEFSKPRYTTLVRELRVGDDEYPPFLAETLEGSLQLAGCVIDALTQQPLAGASVKLSSMYKDWHEEADDKGRFTIKGVFPGEGELVVQAKGYGRERLSVPELDTQSEQVVSLKPERIARLKTVDEQGQAIVGVTIECYDEQRDDFCTAVTDQGGACTLRGLHFDASALSIRLTHQDYVSDEYFDRSVGLPRDKPESSHVLIMIRAGQIGGSVTDGATNKPLYGARVITGEGLVDVSPRDWSSYEGTYTISGVRPGVAVVTVHLSGYGPELKTAEVKAGQKTQLDFQLRPGGTLKGVVKRSGGEPVPHAFVETGRWRNHRSLDLRTMTSEDGLFVIENAPLDEFELIAGAVRTDRITKVVKGGSNAPIEFILPGGAVPPGMPGASALKVGEPAPAFELTTLAGETTNLASLKGKVILLDFWATWCGPCVADLPLLVRAHNEYGSRDDFVMLSVSLDWEEKRLRSFVKERKMTWHQVFGETPGAQAATAQYGVTAIPAVFLIAADGRLIASNLTGEAILRSVEKALNRE